MGFFLSKTENLCVFCVYFYTMNCLNFQDLHPIGSTFKGISIGQVRVKLPTVLVDEAHWCL